MLLRTYKVLLCLWPSPQAWLNDMYESTCESLAVISGSFSLDSVLEVHFILQRSRPSWWCVVSAPNVYDRHFNGLCAPRKLYSMPSPIACCAAIGRMDPECLTSLTSGSVVVLSQKIQTPPKKGLEASRCMYVCLGHGGLNSISIRSKATSPIEYAMRPSKNS